MVIHFPYAATTYTTISNVLYTQTKYTLKNYHILPAVQHTTKPCYCHDIKHKKKNSSNKKKQKSTDAEVYTPYKK